MAMKQALRIPCLHDDNLYPARFLARFLDAQGMYFEQLDIANRKDIIAFKLTGKKTLMEK